MQAGRGREGDRIWSRLQAPSSQHRARQEAQTHKLQGYDLSWSWRLNWLSHPGSLLFIFERHKETEQQWGRDRERGRHRIWSRLQPLSLQHRPQRRAPTQERWDHDLSRSRTLNWLSHTGPRLLVLLLEVSHFPVGRLATPLRTASSFPRHSLLHSFYHSFPFIKSILFKKP